MIRMIEGVLANRVAANLLMVFLVISGIASLSALNVRVFPPIETYNISITVPYPGATPEDVETSIVRPIEERLEGHQPCGLRRWQRCRRHSRKRGHFGNAR